MEKRYQVFLSSTYIDLKEERLEVMRALLELDCIPSGMEYFPATNDDQWTYIQELIDQCDYYIVVVGARYESTSKDGLSFTEKEYRYALEKGIPVIGFLHAQPDNIPQGRAEVEPEARKKLEQFRILVKSKLCKEWSSPAELGAVVSRSLTQLIKRTPRTGWVRSDKLASSEANEEILRLRQLIDKKDEQLDRLVLAKAASTESLAHGDDQVELKFAVTLTDPTLPYAERHKKYTGEQVFSWDDVYKSFAPHLMIPSKLSAVKSGIIRLIKEKESMKILSNNPGQNIGAITIPDSIVQMVIIQFTAMGFIEVSNIEDKDHKFFKHANLTPSGLQYIINASAVKRGTIARAQSTAEDSVSTDEKIDICEL